MSFTGFRALATLALLVAGVANGAPPVPPPDASYPSRPVRLVVPFAAGGPADYVARTLAPALEKTLGQPFVVENRLGAEGAIAAQAVLGASADGYTLLFAGASLVPIALLKKQPAFDLRADFAPISKVVPSPWAMYVSPQVPARSLAEFIAHARENPGKLNYASSTMNDFMAAAQFMRATGTSMTKVPYKGASQALPDLVTGRVQVNFSPVSASGLEHARAGQLRILAVFAQTRSPLAPDVPTMDEAGVSGLSVPGWLAVFAPARTPQDIIGRLHRAIGSALTDADLRAQLGRQSLQVEGSTPEALAALVEEDLRTWSNFIRENGIAPE
jgi:tripartite-type tricarboxylate transporter receptor subunit TctC